MKKILAIASAGGHLQELLELHPVLGEHDVTYVTTVHQDTWTLEKCSVRLVVDCNRNTPFAIILCSVQLMYLFVSLRPNTVISTGALPGLIAIVIGHFLKTYTIWLDSIANASEMSLSGQKAKKYSRRWLTQWRHVAESTGADFHGSVL